MHMRRKPWARPELAACPFFVDTPDHLAVSTRFAAAQPLYLELGCGKGVSTSNMAFDNPSINYVAVDISRDVLAVCRRNVARVYGDAPVQNLLLVAQDIDYIDRAFSPETRFDRVYISFCNPWSEKKRHEKRRLTHPRKLQAYRAFLSPGAQIHFKTDDAALFFDSLGYLTSCGFTLSDETHDLARANLPGQYVSEHEQKFTEAGKPIYFVVARLTEPSKEGTL